MGVGHPLRCVRRVPDHPADHEAAAHDHVADEHVPEGQGPAQGRDEAHAEPDGDRPRDVRRRDRRGLHLEAALRHRRLHDLRSLHVGVPGARHRQAARPARDRAEGRRGDGRDRRPRGVAAGGHRPRHHHHRRLGVRAHHVGRAVGVHVVQGVRRDLPGEHRDPRQDPRHAPLPLAHGERLPRRARQHVPVDGELVERLRDEPGRAGRLGRSSSRASTSSSGLGSARARVPLLGRLRRLASTTATRRRAARVAKLLQRAGLDFAILGPSELCTGDSARRSGNEYIFQMLAMQNIETLDGLGVQEDHHAVPALLQHAEERVPAARRQLRGGAPLAAAQPAHVRRPALARRRLARRARHVPRQLLPRSPQRRVPRAAQRDRSARRHRRRRDAAQRHQGHVLRRRRRAHVDGGAHRQEGEHRAHRRGARHRCATHRGRLPVLLRDDGRRREGEGPRRRRQGPGHRRDPDRGDRAGERAPAPLTAEFQPGI